MSSTKNRIEIPIERAEEICADTAHRIAEEVKDTLDKLKERVRSISNVTGLDFDTYVGDDLPEFDDLSEEGLKDNFEYGLIEDDASVRYQVEEDD